MELIRNGKKVEKIEFVLEDLNVIGVPISEFNKFELEMVETEDGFAVKKLDVKINYHAKDITSVSEYGQKTDLERIQRLWNRTDITSLVINYDNNTKEIISVYWNEKEDYYNADQDSIVDQEDNLIINIYSEEFNQEGSLYNLYINKVEVLRYLNTYIKEIQEKSKKTESNIGALNMLNRVAADIKNGHVGKVMF